MTLTSVRGRYYLYSLTETQGLIVSIWVVLLRARGLSYTAIGALGALYWAVLVFAEVPTGYVGDRVGRRASLFVSGLMTAAGIGALGIVHTVTLFAIALAMWAVGTALRSGCADAWLYDVLTVHDATTEYTRIRGQGQGVKFIASATTALLGSFLYVQSHTLPFLLTAGLLCVNALVVLTLPAACSVVKRNGGAVASESPMKTSTRTGLTALTSPPLRGFVFYTVMLFGLVEVARTFVQPIVVGERVGLPVVVLGGLYAGFNIAGAAASAATDRIERTLGIRRWFLVVPPVLAVSFCSLPLVPMLAVPSFVGMQAVWRVSQTLQISVVNEHVESPRRATLLSAVSMIGGIAAIVFRAVGGMLADRVGPLVMLAILAAAFLIIVIPFLLVTPIIGSATATR